MNIPLEFDREEDGRWIAEVPSMPGVMAYGATQEDAGNRALALALRVLADRLEHGEGASAVYAINITRYESMALR